ncbi:argininosuccinate lyase [Candidatus Peregrinibacteria bacterium]|nr:argininosuccinate lyase [Candidatus Peregrinibacteria bacterium]
MPHAYRKLPYKKVHAGRSRNDQILTAMRLYMKDSLNRIRREVQKLAQDFLELAGKYKKIPMPGYTHTQQAMLSSVGHYFCAYTESLLDDMNLLDSIYHHIDKSPLGSAAGYGVALLLPREFTKRELKFKQLQVNSLYCQNSRGKFESIYLEGLAQIMLTLNKFASDIILFTSQEFAFFKVKNNLVTGSSIMPQKRNLDGLEILRAKTHTVTTNQSLVKDICKNLISGYHRDLQLIKKPLIESTNTVLQSLEVANLYLNGLEPNANKMSQAITKEIFTADLATEMSKKIPFRDAYKQALKAIKKQHIDLEKNLADKISLGAPGNLDLNYYKNLLFEEKRRKGPKKI